MNYLLVQCGSLTKQGKRCCNVFKTGSFCWVHSPKETEIVTCSICLTESPKNSVDNIVLYECGHVFCKSCINTWINKNSDKIITKEFFPTCPLCRQDINCGIIKNSIIWGLENGCIIHNRRTIKYDLNVLTLDEQIYFAANMGITAGQYIDNDKVFENFVIELKLDPYGIYIYNKLRRFASVGYMLAQKDKIYGTLRLFE